jgi:hypothetical protein
VSFELTPGAPEAQARVSARKPASGPLGVQSSPSPAGVRVAVPDAPCWHLAPSAAHWDAPAPCGHPDDRALGPCCCARDHRAGRRP